MNSETKENHVPVRPDPAIGSHEPIENRAPGCTDSVVGSQVFDYIVDRLSEARAETVEDHLLKCAHCHERFLIVIDGLEAMRDRLKIGNGHFEHAEEIAAALEAQNPPKS